MKNLKAIAFVVLALLLPLGSLNAQATLGTTTLSAALTGTDSSATPGNSTDLIYVTSISSFVQNSVGQYQTLLYVDFEAMDVLAVMPAGSNNQIRVVRGAHGTKATKHNSGATVYVGPPVYFGGAAGAGANTAGDKVGACISTNELALPFININDGKIFDCRSSGQWIQIGLGTMGSPPGELISQLCTGAVTSSSTTDYVVAGEACTVTTGIPVVVTSPGTLFNFRVHSSAAAASTSSDEIATVVKNGTGTAITCNLSGVAVCSDLTHSVAVAAGDLITFSYLSGTTDTAANLTMSVEKQ